MTDFAEEKFGWRIEYGLGIIMIALGLIFLTPITLAQEHDGHDMAGMSHDGGMDKEMIEDLKKIIPPLAEMTDEQIIAMMKMMPPDYEWYVSEKSLQGDVGVLVVAHGFGEVGDKVFAEALEPVGTTYPTTAGFGMTMMSSAHLQSSADNLTAAGAKTIVVVPASQSRHDTGIRQWQYVFNKREEPAYLPVARVESDAEFIISPPMADHPIVSQILLDHAQEIATEQANEVVIIVGHGPAGDEDNARELAMVQTHVDYIRDNSDFADVHAINLQDDSFKDTRAANVKTLRSIAEGAAVQGHRVLIVGFLVGTAGIQPKIESDLAGLDFKFNGKGMSQNPRFASWVKQMVEDALGDD